MEMGEDVSAGRKQGAKRDLVSWTVRASTSQHANGGHGTRNGTIKLLKKYVTG